MRRIGPGGALALALAVAMMGGAATNAQEGDVPVPIAVSVTGTSRLVGETVAGTTSAKDGVVHQRGAVLVTNEVSTDPRVEGTGTITLNVEAFTGPDGVLGSSQVRYGRMRIENEGGSWEGAFAGRLSNGRFLQTYWLRGRGGYDGLTYVVTAGGDGPVWASEGLIYPGSPPPGAPLGPVDAPRPQRDPPLALAPAG
jgi:hypothetical protein